MDIYILKYDVIQAKVTLLYDVVETAITYLATYTDFMALCLEYPSYLLQ